MSFVPTDNLQQEVSKLITHYPEDQKRSASLMVLHAIQEQEGFISAEAMKWAADKIGIQPLNLYELVTFYPMLREEKAGKFVLKVCRTLGCNLAGSANLHKNLCSKLNLNPKIHGIQTTEDGKFSIEFAECLASCGTGPAMMCNDDFYESVSNSKADDILDKCD